MEELNKKGNMNRKFRVWHKWVSLLVGIPLLLMCLSGIILNHRSLWADIDVSRAILPEVYHFKNWNNGLLKGTYQVDSTHLLIYGRAGIWEADLSSEEITDYNEGFPEGVDNRTISRIVQAENGTLYAAAQFSLYKKEKGNVWEKVVVPLDEGDESVIPFDGTRLTDIAIKGDSVVLTSRSHIYVYHPEKNTAEELVLQMPIGEQPSISLFRIFWRLHSGEMFGIGGKLFVDSIALVFIFLCISGLILWLWPKRIKRLGGLSAVKERIIGQMRWNGKWHDRIGRVTIILTLFVVVTGWFLRPPLLIAIASQKMELSAKHENVWDDKLRALQYDEQMGDWLLYTSDGFYSLESLNSSPRKTEVQPPVGVMGINVFCREFPPSTYTEEERWKQQVWIVGSFSGLYAWHRPSNQIYDMTNGITLPPHAEAMPFGSVKVSGYSTDVFPSILCSYDEGILLGNPDEMSPLPQPVWMNTLPISLWNLALEVHTGRIFTFLGIFSTLLYIFIIGVLMLVVLLSGWLIRRKTTNK